MASYLFADRLNSTLDTYYTFHYSKLSCWVPVYYVHIAFAFLIGLSGVVCFVTRLVPKWRWLHKYAGRCYIISMLWGTATSLLIHNTGLPIGVLWSFLWVLTGLSLGWLVITIHQVQRHNQQPLPAPAPGFVAKLVHALRKMVTWKSVHGCLMFVSWINIVGRIFNSPDLSRFDCHTYPFYKPVQSTKYTPLNPGEWAMVPTDNPNYSEQPWAGKENFWAVSMSLGMYAFAVVVGVIFIVVTTKADKTAAPLDADVDQESGDTEKPNVSSN
jgi:uncharacterized membrane protein